MSDSHSPDEIKKHVKIYMLIFGALLVGTIVTVLASKIHFGSTKMNIIVALIIATIKAGLVAGFFMHLNSERKTIYAILLATVFFFIGLMALTLFSMADIPLVK